MKIFKYIKELDIKKPEDAHEFATLLNEVATTNKTGNLTLIDNLIDLFYSNQDVNSSFKAYAIVCEYAMVLQSRNNKRTAFSKESFKGLIKAMAELCKTSELQTFAFYNELTTTIKSFMDASGISERTKLGIYAFSKVFEKILTENNIAFTSFDRLLSKENEAMKLKVKLASIFYDEII